MMSEPSIETRDSRLRDFRHGFTAILPVCLAAFPIGVLWGGLAAEKGLSVFEAGLMSFLVFAGAAQFAVLGLWSATPPLAAILVTTALVNARHLIMGASLGRQIAHFTRMQRYLAFFTMVDEVWAFAEARARHSDLRPAYYAGLAVPLVPVWTISSMIGAAWGDEIADLTRYGVDFVFTAVFLALIVGFRAVPHWLAVVSASAAASILVHQVWPGAWSILAGAAAGMAVAAAAPTAGADAGDGKAPAP